ncbi:hypothetical protein B0F86_01705, partial [Pseudomonas syringae]
MYSRTSRAAYRPDSPGGQASIRYLFFVGEMHDAVRSYLVGGSDDGWHERPGSCRSAAGQDGAD